MKIVKYTTDAEERSLLIKRIRARIWLFRNPFARAAYYRNLTHFRKKMAVVSIENYRRRL